MKVWALEAYGHYGGGLAIVAAPNAEEAKKIGATIRDSMWHTNYGVPESCEELPTWLVAKLKEPTVITHYETGE